MYKRQEEAGRIAKQAVHEREFDLLAKAVATSYQAQLGEGMQELAAIEGAVANKYCGGGHGGYALYLFSDQTARDAAVAANEPMRPIEPYCR